MVLGPVADTHQFATIAAGSDHTCAIDTDRAAWCWGWDNFGQLGNGFPAFDQSTPATVVGEHAFLTAAAGMHHSCGIAVDGSGWCWGFDAHGMLGDGDPLVNQYAPVQVVGGHVFTVVAAGDYHSCAIDSDGVAWCWGYNPYGQLGDGTATQRSAPVVVFGGITWKQP